MDKLKPCPFCGGEAMVEEAVVRKGYEATVVCTGCLVDMPTITYDTPEEAYGTAVKAWNRRVKEKAEAGYWMEERLAHENI